MKDAATFFAVLADETRLRMLWLLFHHDELCVCDLVEALGITQSKASRHLATMRHAGVVVDRKDGLWSYYALRRPAGELARRHLDTLRATLAGEPGSGELLERLDRWLRAKACGSACATAGSTKERPASSAASAVAIRARPAADRDATRPGAGQRAGRERPATARGRSRKAGGAR